jgi:eukaryotic-like serine/threonine-protein kinase
MGRLSPDGRFLAYVSNESKRYEIYVETFPEHGGKWQISTAGVDGPPAWSRDGRQLYFLFGDDKSGDDLMMAVDLRADSSKLDVGIPKPLFAVPLFEGLKTTYDVSQDGRFLIHVPVKQAAASVPLTVVVNWQSALKK